METSQLKTLTWVMFCPTRILTHVDTSPGWRRTVGYLVWKGNKMETPCFPVSRKWLSRSQAALTGHTTVRFCQLVLEALNASQPSSWNERCLRDGINYDRTLLGIVIHWRNLSSSSLVSGFGYPGCLFDSSRQGQNTRKGISTMGIRKVNSVAKTKLYP
jgi:hypothetical protein